MPKLTVVVPVFNEAPDVVDVLNRLLGVPCPIEREVVVVDDGSTDGTVALLRELAAEGAVRLLTRSRRGGKSAAVADGIAAATGEYLIVHDADREYDPRDIARLLQPLLDGEADVVYGSRFRREGTMVHRTFHFLVNRLLTDLSNALSGIYLTDMETCYKLFRADLVKSMRLRAQGFGFEVEATAYLAKTRARILELPISYHPRTRLAGKKIGWTDGLAALWQLVRFNLLVDLEGAFAGLPERYLPEGKGAAQPAVVGGALSCREAPLGFPMKKTWKEAEELAGTFGSTARPAATTLPACLPTAKTTSSRWATED